MNDTPMIKLDHVTKRYGDTLAVDDLCLEVPAGQILAFLGPNGAGKTTTIRMMAGLLRATAGEIHIGGHSIERNHIEAKRLIGYIPDRPYLYEKLSAREFIHFVGDLHRIPRDVQDAHIEEYLALFELTESTDRLISNFSHGMRQKLVFTASLLHSPRLLIVDEPMVGLDPKSARIIKGLMRRLAERGTTVFLSTHQLAVAEEVADEVGIIDHGHLLFRGTVDELHQRTGSDDRGRSLEDLFLDLTGEANR